MQLPRSAPCKGGIEEYLRDLLQPRFACQALGASQTRKIEADKDQCTGIVLQLARIGCEAVGSC